MIVVERPILMSGQMVKAILEGRKTQTRRPLKSQPVNASAGMLRALPAVCPYGQPGDKLWVRERHCYLDVCKSHLSQFPLGPQNNNEVGPNIWNVCVEYSGGTENDKSLEGDKPKQTRERGEQTWRPSIFMPRWASRITLEVIAVRVERVQEIDEADAEAEGVERRGANDQHGDERNFCEGYRELWNSLNAKRGFGWDKNPWVWVVEFKRI